MKGILPFRPFTPLRPVRVIRICRVILVAWLTIALLAPLIANHKPLYVSYKGQSCYPAFSSRQVWMVGEERIDLEHTDWKLFSCERILFPLVPWSPGKPDYANAGYVSPSAPNVMKGQDGRVLPARFRHVLGTDKLGRDTLSGLIHGARVSLLLGIFSMLLASLIGITLGATAGYFGDHGLRTRRGVFLAFIPGIVLGFFYGFQVRAGVLAEAWNASGLHFTGQLLLSLLVCTTIAGLFTATGRVLARIPYFGKPVFVKLDSMVSRTVEVLISLPRLVLIIAIAAIAKPSYVTLVLIIGLTAWTDIARLTRAEMMRLRQMPFIDSARAMGLSSFRIIFRHALPNGIAPALVAIAFGVSSAVLAESALSFLGAGVPQDVVTWGSMLAQGREHFQAWWLVLLPGAAIFSVVVLFNMLGEALRVRLSGR